MASTEPQVCVRSLLCVTFGILILVGLWDVSGLDMKVAQLTGTPYGFPWRFSKALEVWLHTIPRIASWATAAALVGFIWWPLSFMRRLDKTGRTQLAFSVVVCVLVVSLAKSASRTSCPYDLSQLGGLARHVSQWAWGIRDGGFGGCFPAGHASAAFAYVGGYFVFRHTSPRTARIWLTCALVLGVSLGVSQQLRDAHFTSHTLWTAWICWAVSFLIGAAVQRYRLGPQRRNDAAVPRFNSERPIRAP